jgi:hypothetical protein
MNHTSKVNIPRSFDQKRFDIFRTTGWLLLTLIAALLTGSAEACCPAPPLGRQVQIADQEIVVVWNEEEKIEHFFRKADFAGNAEDFGFLVPTPTKPELAEADGAIFDRFEQATKPRIEIVKSYKFEWSSMFMFKASLSDKSMNAVGDAVMILDRVRVAGMDAVVLASTSSEALAKWLEDNGYNVRPTIEEWLKPYVEQGWKITAFKYAPKGGEAKRTSTAAVRMSFRTDRPVFPYRVPTDQLQNKRSELRDQYGRRMLTESVLRVHFVGNAKVSGGLGNAKATWPAEMRYAGERTDLADLLKGSGIAAELPATGWLTSFDDSTWPGGTEDLYFDRAADQEPYVKVIEKKVVEGIVIPLELLILAVVACGFVVIIVLRFRRASSSALQQ